MVMRPSPGVIRTRAIAVFRRPVPRAMLSAKFDVSSLVEGDGLRLLRRVLVLGPGVHAEPLQHLPAQGVALEHAADGIVDGKGRVPLLLLAEGALAQATRVARVARIGLAIELDARDQDPR